MKHLFLLLTALVLIQCKNKSNLIEPFDTIKNDTTQLKTSNQSIEKKYLSLSEIRNYLKKSPSLNINKKLKVPFNKFKFDKVIAYDFDGNGDRERSIYNNKNKQYSKVIIKQQVLSIEDINSITNILTAQKTYGEGSASCFDPHLGLIFYKENSIQLIIDICLDCNSFRASKTIPASQHNKVSFENGDFYYLDGFSKQGKEDIIEFSKKLNLHYGNYIFINNDLIDKRKIKSYK